jgi:hypothetical protein
VEASATGQCLWVEHVGVPVDRVLSVIRGHLHAEETSSAEHVMVEIDPQVAELHCSHRHRSGDGDPAAHG